MSIKGKTLIALLFSIFLNYSQLFSQKKLSIKDIWFNYQFAPEYFDDITFLSNNENFAKSGDYSIKRCDAITGDSIGCILDFSKFKILKNKIISSFKISSNDSLILLETDSKKIYRFSKLSSYFVYDRKSNKISPLIEDNEDIDVPCINPKNTSIAFVKDNNLFISEKGKSIQITFDGKQNEVKNGRADWVYEEEFGVIRAYEWSPDGTKIAWIRFDETEVPSYTLLNFDSIYPSTFTYKYPKAGFPNSKVRVHIYDCKSGLTSEIKIPTQYEYIPLISWSNDGTMLAIQTYNRLQNHTIIYAYYITNGNSEKIYEEKRDTYIPFPMGFTWLRHNKRFALITEKKGFDQLCTFTLDGKMELNITNWKYDVTKVLAYDSLLDYVFFEAAEPDEMQRRIYRVRPDGSFLGFITPESGTNSDAVFSNDYLHCIYTNTNARQEISVYSFDELKQRKSILQTNVNEIDSLTKQYGFGKKIFFRIPVDTIKLNAWMMKPSVMDSGRKYPVLITIYAGPGHQDVVDEYDYTYFWHQYLVQNGIIVISIDPRGTDGRGAAFRNCAYKQLGIPQTNDLIAATRYLTTLPYIDSTKIAMYGWSFGGYQTLMCMTHSKLFNCGVAVAPVTDWKFYDNIYTERYMQTPDLNPEGYKKTSVLESAKSMHGALFIAHGDNDDNVHTQNTFALCKLLNQNNYPYQFLLFPGKNHSITGRQSRFKLFDGITDFLIEHLK